MVKVPMRFWVCKCGQTHRGKTKPKGCKSCKSKVKVKVIGEILVKW